MNEQGKELITKFRYECRDNTVGPTRMSHSFTSEELERFVELIINECCDVVLESDPSPKMILHEPYATVMRNIQDRFGV